MEKEAHTVPRTSVRAESADEHSAQLHSTSSRLSYRRMRSTDDHDAQTTDRERDSSATRRSLRSNLAAADALNGDLEDGLNAQSDAAHSQPLLLRSGQPNLSSAEMKRLVDRVYRAVMERVRLNQQRRGLK